jgi:hypothetical protein
VDSMDRNSFALLRKVCLSLHRIFRKPT